jgi:hypothetical protein
MNECECYRWLSNDSVYELMCDCCDRSPVVLCVLATNTTCHHRCVMYGGIVFPDFHHNSRR